MPEILRSGVRILVPIVSVGLHDHPSERSQPEYCISEDRLCEQMRKKARLPPHELLFSAMGALQIIFLHLFQSFFISTSTLAIREGMSNIFDTFTNVELHKIRPTCSE